MEHCCLDALLPCILCNLITLESQCNYKSGEQLVHQQTPFELRMMAYIVYAGWVADMSDIGNSYCFDLHLSCIWVLTAK